jgi:hypothetical protein
VIYSESRCRHNIRLGHEAMPKPEEVKQAATAAAKTTATPKVQAVQSASLAPIVTSLGKVGGGYSPGTLDAQWENNRLTGETNRLLTDLVRGCVHSGGGFPRGRAGSC